MCKESQLAETSLSILTATGSGWASSRKETPHAAGDLVLLATDNLGLKGYNFPKVKPTFGV